jgi:hypothetical protein
MAKSTFTKTPAAVKMDRIVALLETEDMIWTQVAEKLYVHKQTASRYLWYMARQTPRRIHVCRWTEDEKSFRKIPVFRAGDKPNKRKPKPLTPAEVYARIQADPMRYGKRKEKYRVEWHRRKGQPVPPRPVANPFAALGL